MPWNIANLKELKFNNTYLYLGGFKNEKKFKYKISYPHPKCQKIG